MKSKTSLKFILRVAMVVFIAVPLVLMSVAGLFSVSSFSSKLTSDQAGVMALSQTTGVSATINEYVSFLSSVAELDAVKGIASEENGDVGDIFSAYASNNDNITDIIITDIEGHIIDSYTGKDQTLSFFDTDNMKSLSTDASPVSKIFMNANLLNDSYPDSVFYCSKPVLNGSDTVGYIILVADVKVISDYLAGTSYMSGKGTLVIFDEDGTAINADGKDVTALNNIGTNSLKNNIGNYKGKSLSSGDGEYEKFESGSQYGSAGSISGTKWNWIGVYPKSAATPSALSILIFAFVVTLIVCLFNFLIMILSTRRITNPLINMIEKMNVIKGGEKNERFTVSGRSEFAGMAEAFNVMLDEVSFSEELHHTISDISDNMLFEWDFTKEKMYISENFKATFDINPYGAKLSNGKFLDSQMDEENSDKYKRDINRLLKNKDSIGGEYEIMTKSGANMWISLRAHCVTDRLGELIRVLGVITNIDNEKKLNQQLEEKASYDFLSGLYNRNTFEKELDAELNRSASKSLAILFVDIDDFKFINDRFNHTIGDEAIKFVSAKLNKILEKGGFAGRFGGDEFVMCVTQEEQIEDIEQLCMDIIDELYEGYFCELADAHMNIRVSIGISLCPKHSSNGKNLIAQADEAMYFVKKNGKSNYHFFDPDDSNIMDMIHH